MTKFDKYAEALMLTTAKPESDSAGSVSPCAKDGMTQSVEDFMTSKGETMTQPDDSTGEYGSGCSEGDTESDVDIECMGDEGIIVKFSGTAILLPSDVVEAVKSFESGGEEGGEEEGGEEEESDTQEYETDNSNSLNEDIGVSKTPMSKEELAARNDDKNWTRNANGFLIFKMPKKSIGKAKALGYLPRTITYHNNRTFKEEVA